MFKLLTALLFASTLFSASAQSLLAPPTGKICEPYGDSTNFTVTEYDAVMVSVPSDAPAAKNSTPMRVEANAAGITTYWYYTDGFSYKPQFQAATWAFLRENLPALSADLIAVRIAADPIAAGKAFELKWVLTSLTAPELLPVWCPNWAKIKASAPPPILYIVKPSAGYTLRYTYSFDPVTRKRGASNGTVSIRTGTAPTICNAMLARVVEGTQVYASVNGVATTVSACDKG